MGSWEVIVEINGEKESCLIQDIEEIFILFPGIEDQGGQVKLKDGAKGTIEGYYIEIIQQYEPSLIRYSKLATFFRNL